MAAPSSMIPGSGGATAGAHQHHFRRASAGLPPDDSENLNPEEVHKSLRSTANAIQNYSFDSPGILNESRMRYDILDGGGGGGGGGAGHRGGDGGSAAKNKGTPTLEEKMSLLDIASSPGAGGRASVDRFSPPRNGNDPSSLAVHRQNVENAQRGKRRENLLHARSFVVLSVLRVRSRL